MVKSLTNQANRSVELTKAVAYCRTSSATNVGPHKDSEIRQLQAIRSYASQSGIEIVAEFSDPAVSGTDPVETRPGFMALLDRIESNGVRVVLIEEPTRLARQLVVLEAAVLALVERGVRVLTASGEDLTETDDPYKVAARQIAGVFAQLEKARLVGKLKAARDRKRATGVKVEGQKSLAERAGGQALVAEAKRLRRRSHKTGKRRSLREIADELHSLGYRSKTGNPLSPTVVKRLIEGQTEAS